MPMMTRPFEIALKPAKSWARWIGWRWQIAIEVPSDMFFVVAAIAESNNSPSMCVLSLPSMPCGSKTRWSLTHTESKPYASARFAPSRHFSTEACSQKCGSNRPSFNFAFIVFLRLPSLLHNRFWQASVETSMLRLRSHETLCAPPSEWHSNIRIGWQENACGGQSFHCARSSSPFACSIDRWPWQKPMPAKALGSSRTTLSFGRQHACCSPAEIPSRLSRFLSCNDW